MKPIAIILVIACVAYFRWPESATLFDCDAAAPVALISAGAVFDPADYVTDGTDTIFVFGAHW